LNFDTGATIALLLLSGIGKTKPLPAKTSSFMKHLLPFLALALCAFLFQSCLKDTYRETYKIYTPVYKTLNEVRAEMKSGPAQPLQNPGKLNLFGNYIFLNEVGRGIHVIDNSNPSSPKNISFINIPANVDLAVKGSYLYADSYSDVVVLDISQPTNVKPVNFMNNVIKERNMYWYGNNTNADSIRVVVDYEVRDTTVDSKQHRQWGSCPGCAFVRFDSQVSLAASAPQTGVGGSMASFTIINNFLYAVSNSSLYALNISDGATPQLASVRHMGWGIETIYPFQDKLFIGSRTGMFIYNLNNPASPAQIGQFNHANSCDPVIADDKYAYVTLRSGTACNGFINQLDIIDISNLSSPSLVRTIPMTNPHGLAKDGDKLFICDGKDGLKMYDASRRTTIELQKQIKEIETFDVIARQGNAIVVAKDGLYQFSYDNGTTLSQISKLLIDTKN
jgi:hypothetical protein